MATEWQEHGMGPAQYPAEGPPAPGPAAPSSVESAAARAVHLIDASESIEHMDEAALTRRLRDGTFFWLDIYRPEQRDFDVLARVFGFHPLALEDSQQFGERPKLDDYGDYGFLVLYGINPHPEKLIELVEVHCFISPAFLVTVHQVHCPQFDAVRRWFTNRRDLKHPSGVLSYRVADSLVDSYFPVLADFDDRLDELEDDIFHDPDDAQLQDVLRMKRALVALRKVVTPMRDLCARLVNGAITLPGADRGHRDATPATDPARREAERYYRDLYDHLIRISDLVDTYRDLMTGTMDVYLSTVNNRMDSVMKKLTVIATVFLPLTWLTGFFGMNFGAMVQSVGDWQAFLFIGVGSQALAVIVLLWLMKRHSWL